ncbi:ATP-binding cassette domain-containing protein [Apilactobacillus xinyiensis]|uniref:ATP-binding cassette domain-containing protein n=1 Tax=Apilactobacillus xinyiensis TaxID=2841032 RepID=UPI001C7CC9E5|nr:ABC transporter ATP-binding protein [Apilactobacillus xinyiensis]
MKNIIFNIKNYKIVILLAIMIISTGMATAIQFIKGTMVNNAISKNSTGLVTQITLFFIAMVIEVTFYYVEWRYDNYLISNTFYDLKQKIISNAMKFTNHNRDFDNKKATQIISNSVSSLEYTYYEAWFGNLYWMLRIVFVLTSLLLINVPIALVLLVLMIAPLGITKLFKNKIAQMNKTYIDQLGSNLKKYENILNNLTQLHVFHAHDFFFKKINHELLKERNERQASRNFQFILNISYSFISYFSNFAVLAISMLLIFKGSIKIGTAVTLLGLVDQLSMPILSLSRNLSSIHSSIAVRSELNNAIIPGTVKTKVKFNKQLKVNGLKVQLKNSQINYSDVTFNKGKSYIIKGKSGLGKSVFIQSITGLLPFKSGTVTYDKKQINHSCKDDVFDNMKVVQAKNILFDETVINNIFFDRKPSKDEYQYCLNLLPKSILNKESIDTLSTGQIRRVLLLRGLLSKASTLIFDEPTANLDSVTSQSFWQLVFQWQSHSEHTLIVISHTDDNKVVDQFDNYLDFNELVTKYC